MRRSAVFVVLCGFAGSSSAFFATSPTSLAARGAIPAARGLQRPEKTVWSGVFTAEQAKRGEQVYKDACTYCHRDDLSGGFLDDGTGKAPPLAGRRAFDSSFFERWENATVRDLAATVAATMPLQKPTSLSVQAYIDVVSYLLLKNGLPAGDTELPIDVEALGQILIAPQK
jgi:quinoprotein glucose dehydrogenase